MIEFSKVQGARICKSTRRLQIKKPISLDMYTIHVFKINLLTSHNAVLRHLIIFLTLFLYISRTVLVGMKDLSLHGHSITS